MERKTIATILLLSGGLLLVIGALLVNGAPGGSILPGTIYNGQKVECNIGVNAQLTGQLQITSASCPAVDTCIVNPVHGLSILGWVTGTDVNGQVQLTQSGTVYDTQDITKNILAPSSTVSLSACIPKADAAVRIVLKNDQGGTDDEKTVSIQ